MSDDSNVMNLKLIETFSMPYNFRDINTIVVDIQDSTGEYQIKKDI
jgi:hypothetical protein